MVISCADKVVNLTNPDGIQVTCHTRGHRPNIMVFSMEAKLSVRKVVPTLTSNKR
jgi:hypothetical protein